MDLDAVADELYGVPPEQFVAVRTEREKQARGAGDRDLAARIRQLGKPTAVAWLANQLVRARRQEIEPLLELGAGLRAATATLDGEQLRELDRQRHQLVYVLVQHARRLAAAAGRPVSEDTARGLETTLHAALADETAAEQLAGARLTDALQQSTGFPPVRSSARLTLLPTGRAARTDAALRTSVARGDRPRRPGSKADRADPADRADREESAAARGAEAERRAAERKAAEQRAAEQRAAERRAAELELARRAEQRAQTAARNADEARDRARAAADRAAAAVAPAAAAVDRLRGELATATAEHSRLDQELSRLRVDLDATTEAAGGAARRLDEATEHRRHLAG